ncbi:Alpha-mannosidase 2 [Labeo rohita]|uniref:Alpha-mannosidase 2 n=1 Tax=Labeo rohita TaxID=84645 RepID=A0ABQ8L2P6_LABRO|nr:Alpha-mannosidase 2 [Labeo rohita]
MVCDITNVQWLCLRFLSDPAANLQLPASQPSLLSGGLSPGLDSEIVLAACLSSSSSLPVIWTNELARIGLSRMSIRILPPINVQERLARQRNLAALRQQGWDIGAFTQFFWTMSRGLDYDDTALKDIFNACLDDPVPKWEMDNLKILNYWDFSKYVGHRIQWGMPPPPPRPACSDHSTPLPLPSLDQHPLLTPTQKRRARRKRSQSAASINDSDTFPINHEPV